MFSRRIVRVKDKETDPLEDKCKKINNIHRIQPGLQKTYIQMIATSKTSHYSSSQSDTSCAACKTPNSSYRHVNFKCKELKPDILLEQEELLFTLAKK